jgi:sulfonate transport system substrate-binding protein
MSHQLSHTATRRSWLASWSRSALARLVIAGGLVAPSIGLAADEAPALRIGYQKAASTLTLLKAQGTLERTLAPRGIAVKWVEFPAGPQLLEGLNVGSIDFGYTGEAPPVFAQAAGAPIVYVGYEVPTPKAEAVLVQKNSSIQSFAELKGKRIAFNKGSDVHWLVLALLEKNHLKADDIQPVYLAPADARAAFERGAVDAWAIWDPFKSAAIRQLDARVLTTGEGVVSHHQFFLASRDFAARHPDLVDLVIAQAGDVGKSIIADRAAAARQLAPLQGLDIDVVDASLANYAHVFRPIDASVIAEQQRIADAFYTQKLIPKRIATSDALLTTKTAQR